MKQCGWLILLLFVLHVAFVGCDEHDRQPVSKPSAAASISKLTDADLETAVRAELAKDAQLKEADLSVNADAERNEVTLSGTLRSHAAREKAIELAKSARPGLLVNDLIDIKPAG